MSLLKQSTISSNQYLALNIRAVWNHLKQEPFHFWLFCGYLFFEYVRPQSIYPAIDIVPWTKLCVIGAFIGSILSKESSGNATSLAKYFWGLMATVLFSSLFAEFPSISFQYINDAFNWLIVFYLFIRIVTSKFRFFIVLLLIILASYKMSQHAAISWAKRGFAFSRWGVAGTPGYFGNAADLGVQMLVILPISIVFVSCCYSYWNMLKKIIFLLLPVTVVMTVIATGERNTIVGLVAMCFVTVLTRKNRIKNLLLMIIFGVVFYAAMPQAYIDRFETAGKDGTSISRLTYWKRGVEFFNKNPILGIGYSNWIPYYAKYYPGESLRPDQQEIAHSTPIIVLAELGLLGIFFYYGIALKMIFININSIKIARQGNERIWRDIPFALNIGLIGFLGASFFITVTFYPFLFIQSSLSAALFNILAAEQKVVLQNNMS